MPAPKLLVSVRDAAEAAAALAGGADVVDVKEPARGALGAADPAVWAAVLRTCAGRVPVSVALGEAAAVLAAVPADAWCGVAPGGVVDRPDVPPRVPLPAGLRWAKLGPAGLFGDRSDLDDARDRFVPPPPGGADDPRFAWVTVAYADHVAANCPPPGLLLAASARCGAFLLDTFTNDGRTLFDHLTDAAVADLCGAAKAHGLTVALAGSLKLDDVPRAAGCGADVVAVRTAACDGGRAGRVSEPRVRALKNALANI